MTIKTLFKLTLFSLFSLFSPFVFATPPGFHLVSQDDYGIVLELSLADFTFHTISGADNLDYQRLEVAQPWAKTDQVGYPEVPFTATLLQVPPAGGLQVEILEQVSETMSVARLYPTPQSRASQNGDIVQHFVKNATAYTSQTFYPSSLITLDKRALWRDVPTVRVNVYPFQWNPHTQQLRYATYLRFRVRFSEPLPPSLSATEAPATAGFEPLLRSVIPGYQSRQSPTRLPRQEMGSPQWPYRYSVNLSIKDTGMYRVTGEELSASGMPTECLSQGQLRLYQQGQPVVPQRVAYSHRWFGLQDSLVFYAHSVENTFSNTNIYRLDCWQLSRSRPLPTVSPEAKLSKWGNILDGTIKGTGQPVTSFQEKVRIEENLLMDDMLPGSPQQDYWFWEQLEAPANQEISIPVMMPDTASKNAEAYIRVGLRGVSTATQHPNHHTRISLNQTKIGDYTWDGDKENVQKFSISPTLLKHGDNTLRIDSLDDTGAKVDVIYSNWVEIVYPRQLVATQDQLKFSLTGKGRQTVQVTQFSTPDISVYDITDPTDLKEVVNVTVAPGNIGYQVTFEDYINPDKTYYALTTQQLRPAESLVLLPSSTLKQPTNGADYLLITAKEFLPAAQTLLERRSQQGLRVMGVSIEDIYNEFGFGFRTPQALKDFLAYAYQNWQPPAPAYVLLLGDSSLDYKGYLGEAKTNIIPPYMIATVYDLAPSDNWYVTLQGEDVLPEMMIGRLPSSNVAEVKQMVDKIIQYETDTQISPSVLLVADNDPSFEAASEKVVSQIPSTVTLNKLYLGQYQDDNQATLDLLNYLELGVSVTQYLGHGNETVWANAQGQKLLQVSDLMNLNDTGNLTFLVILNCLNANFSDVKRYSLAEQFLLAKDKGAFASFAPTSVGYLWEHQLLDAALFELLFKENRRLLGELTTQAKVLAYSRGTSELGMNTFVLLGDPASTLYLPLE